MTPVIGMRKSEIVRRGIELGAPLERTWSCYQFDDEACGICDSCRLRLRAFAEAGIARPDRVRQPGCVIIEQTRFAGRNLKMKRLIHACGNTVG